MKSKYFFFLKLLVVSMLCVQSVFADEGELVELFLDQYESPEALNLKSGEAPVDEFTTQQKEDAIDKLPYDKKIEVVKKIEFKDQKASLTPWGKIDIDHFLSFKEWKFERDLKDQNPEWERVLRERKLEESMGKIYQCIGKCRVERGQSYFNGQHRSTIYEGDEIETLEDSYAWIFFLDGTMMRMAPKTSVRLNEINIGQKNDFLSVRINYGSVLWLSRDENLYEEHNLRDTDAIFFPYAEYEAIPIEDKPILSDDNLFLAMEESNTNLNYRKKLNYLIDKNNLITKKKKTYAFIVLPNVTIMGIQPSFDIVHLLKGKSYFNLRSQKVLEKKGENLEVTTDANAQLRGMDNKSLSSISEDLWYEVDADGNTLGESSEAGMFNINEFITKRPTRILVGREIFLDRYSKFVFSENKDPLKFAKDYGYRLWTELDDKGTESKFDMSLRLEYLKEYFRRVETTNLKSGKVFEERQIERGNKVDKMEYGDYFYSKAMDAYYMSGKKNNEVNSKELFEDLNSMKKTLWKNMHGIR